MAAQEFSIATFNVFNKLCNKFTKDNIEKHLKDVDILCTQEDNDKSNAIIKELFKGTVLSCGEDTSKESMKIERAYTRDKTIITLIDCITTDPETTLADAKRCTALLFSYNGITIANLHLEGGGEIDTMLFNDTFDNYLKYKLLLLDEVIKRKPDIILGDFDSAYSPDKGRNTEFLEKRKEYFKRLSSSYSDDKIKQWNNDFVDKLTPHNYTYAKPSNETTMITYGRWKSIVDFIWYNPNTLKINKTEIIDIHTTSDNYPMKNCISDHNPVVAKFRIIASPQSSTKLTSKHSAAVATDPIQTTVLRRALKAIANTVNHMNPDGDKIDLGGDNTNLTGEKTDDGRKNKNETRTEKIKYEFRNFDGSKPSTDISKDAFYDKNANYYLLNGANKTLESGGGGTNEALTSISEDIFKNENYICIYNPEYDNGLSADIKKIIEDEKQKTKTTNTNTNNFMAGAVFYIPLTTVKKNAQNINGVYHINAINWNDAKKDDIRINNIVLLVCNYYAAILEHFIQQKIIRRNTDLDIINLSKIPGLLFKGGDETFLGIIAALMHIQTITSPKILNKLKILIYLDISKDKYDELYPKAIEILTDIRNSLLPIPPNPLRKPQYFQSQESLGCGRHALNNLFGDTYFIEDDGTDFDDTTQRLPISLKSFCKHIQKETGDPDKNYCQDDENYAHGVIARGISELLLTNEYIAKDNKDFNTRIKSLETNNYIGFIVGTDGHWYTINKLNNKYFLKDSLITSFAKGKEINDITEYFKITNFVGIITVPTPLDVPISGGGLDPIMQTLLYPELVEQNASPECKRELIKRIGAIFPEFSGAKTFTELSNRLTVRT